MTLTEFLATWRGTTLENRVWRIAILVLVVANLVLVGLVGQVERTVVLVPPVLEGEVTIARDRASQEVEEAWGLYVAELLGNVSPATVESLTRVLDPLFAGGLRRAVMKAIAEQTEAIKRENVSMRFSPRQVSYDPATRTVFVTGTHRTEGPAAQPVSNERTYEVRVEFRNYRPLITHLDVYRGEPRSAADRPDQDTQTGSAP
jgi:conjugal transfer pilus assembly protein TraE